jgi:hypothetical protein
MVRAYRKRSRRSTFPAMLCFRALYESGTSGWSRVCDGALRVLRHSFASNPLKLIRNVEPKLRLRSNADVGIRIRSAELTTHRSQGRSRITSRRSLRTSGGCENGELKSTCRHAVRHELSVRAGPCLTRFGAARVGNSFSVFQ